MSDVATLSLKIDSTQAAEGAAALERLESASRGAEAAASGVGRSFAQMGSTLSTASNFSVKIGGEFRRIDQAATSLAGGLPRVSQAINGAARANDGLAASTERVLSAEERRARALAKTAGTAQQQAEQARLLAAFMAQTGSASKVGAKALDAYGMSAKQTAQAMRLLPMQITDVVTSLSSGMPVWQVAIQQGGQIRDSFGGVGNAFKAVLQFIGPVRLAIGGVVGAIAGLTAAYIKGASEQENFNKALILTGNYAGTTAGQMATMAQSISSIVGTQADAAAALSALAGTGQIAGDQLERFATTAVRMERTVGQSVEKTARQFAELAKAPVEASLKLNEETRHLTLVLYEEIKALWEAGRATDAAALAMRAYSDAMDDRTGRIVDNIGDIERAWRAVRDAIGKVLDGFLEIGRQETPQQVLAAARQKVADLEEQQRGWGIKWGLDDALKLAREELRIAQARVDTVEGLAKVEGDYQQRQQAGIKAARENERILAGTLTKQQQLNKALDEYRRNNEAIRAAGGILDPKKVAAEEAAIRRKFATSAGGSASRETRDDVVTRLVLASRERQAALQAQIDGEERLGAAARALVQFEQQIADLKEKKTLTAEQKQLLAGQERVRVELQAEAALERQNKAIEERKKQEEEAARIRERGLQRAIALEQQLADANEMRRAQYDQALAGMNLGPQAQERMRGEQALQREFARLQAREAIQHAKEGTLDSDEYRRSVAAIKASLDQALADHATYYERLRIMQGDWRIGASAALNAYLEESENVAQRTAQAFGESFQVMEEGLFGALQGEYKSARQFFDAMERDFIAVVNRMIAKALAANLAKRLMGGDGTSGPVGSFLASLFGGAAGIGYGTAGTAAATSFVPAPGGGFVPALAKGGVVGPDGIDQKFASGGVVTRPTLFKYGDNKTGLMGEAGYEGVLPLARGKDGKLGVRAQGGGGGITVNAPMTIVTPDAESFRRSEGQITSRISGALSRSRRYA